MLAPICWNHFKDHCMTLICAINISIHLDCVTYFRLANGHVYTQLWSMELKQTVHAFCIHRTFLIFPAFVYWPWQCVTLITFIQRHSIALAKRSIRWIWKWTNWKRCVRAGLLSIWTRGAMINCLNSIWMRFSAIAISSKLPIWHCICCQTMRNMHTPQCWRTVSAGEIWIVTTVCSDYRRRKYFCLNRSSRPFGIRALNCEWQRATFWWQIRDMTQSFVCWYGIMFELSSGSGPNAQAPNG